MWKVYLKSTKPHGVSKKWWPGANILVFNTGNWWVMEKIEQWGIQFQVGNNLTTHGLEDAFQIAMKTWGLWMEDNLDPATKLFFRSYAPRHFSGGSWNSGGHCNESVSPLTDLEGQEMMETPWTDKLILDAINHNVKRKRRAVEFLDITTSTNYRSDGHPGAFFWFTPRQRSRLQPLLFAWSAWLMEWGPLRNFAGKGKNFKLLTYVIFSNCFILWFPWIIFSNLSFFTFHVLKGIFRFHRSEHQVWDTNLKVEPTPCVIGWNNKLKLIHCIYDILWCNRGRKWTLWSVQCR